MRFAFIHAHAQRWPIVTMCRVLEVSRAGYYAWRARPLCQRRQTDGVLTAQIRWIAQQVHQRYGSPRVCVELRARGVVCGKHRVARLMRQAGLRATRGPRRPPRGRAGLPSAPGVPNVLARRFAPAQHAGLNRTWVADLTYVPTREGWLYLAVVLDLASRRVVGWALRTRLEPELAVAALRMALAHRRARGGLHHSDRGVQYTSYAYQQLLGEAGLTPSLSRIGDCWDNAVVESFFATLTKELLEDTVFDTRAQASRALFEFIEIWYNRQRRHSTLSYRSPVEYEAALLNAS